MIKKYFVLLLTTSFLISLLSIQCKKEKIPLIEDENNEPVSLEFTQAEKDTIFLGDSSDFMRIMNYFIPEDSVILVKTSKEVLIKANDTIMKRLTDRMLTSVISANGVGIAAPQVGISRKVIWVQRYDKGTFSNRPFEVYLNPKITAYSDTVARRADGCLSVPQTASYPDVVDSSYRALWVDVEYYLPDGSFVQERVTHWYTAHIFQHEIDHLNGIMFFDRYVTRNKSKFIIIADNLDDYEQIRKERFGN
ncbi:MAG: peptide deformylase [Bacteroidales bacterium]|nr:peptide deformylase [Bacteroidales bacterium]